MSVLATLENGWLIDHAKYIEKVYLGLGLRPKEGLFGIKTPFRTDIQAENLAAGKTSKRDRKRKRATGSTAPEVVRHVLENIRQMEHFSGPPGNREIRENNKSCRDLASRLDTATEVYQISGGNQEERCQISRLENGLVVILPKKCQFFVDDVANLAKLKGQKFDLIIMDPPWENKHVKRKRGYEMMSNEELCKNLPISDLISPDKGHVVIWTTNSPRHKAAVLDWLGKWNLTLCATWYWLKVTISGEPVVSWDHPHKKPYEMVYIASSAAADCDIFRRHDGKVVVSVPSAIHSHKPPLLEILSQLIQFDSCLEIFGRYLTPNCTTFGNQALKFQDERFFDKKPIN